MAKLEHSFAESYPARVKASGRTGRAYPMNAEGTWCFHFDDGDEPEVMESDEIAGWEA